MSVDTRRSSAKRKHSRRPAVWIVAASLAAVVIVGSVLAAARDDGRRSAARPSEAGSGVTATLAKLDGGEVSLTDFRGTPLVVNFMASWCVACQAELPAFQALSSRLGTKVQFLGVALQDTPQDAKALVESTGVTYPVALDPDGTLFQSFGASSMPTTVLIRTDGRVAAIHAGELTAQELADLIDEKLLS